MVKFTARWRLYSALGSMGAPMIIINQKSTVFDCVIEDMKFGGLSPDEGARRVLKAVHGAFDQPSSPLK